MSTSIRICSYLLLPLIYLLVNVKIAQLGESFPITIVTFLPVLLLLFLERISVKKLMIALGIGAGLTAFNYLFGQSLDASKYVTSTMLFVYIVMAGVTFCLRLRQRRQRERQPSELSAGHQTYAADDRDGEYCSVSSV